MPTEQAPSFVRVARVTSILAEDQVLSKKLSGTTQEVARRDGHKQKFPAEAITIAKLIHADGKDVAHLGRGDILKYARDHFKVEAAPKEPARSISEKNSRSVHVGIASLVETAVGVEQSLPNDKRDPKAAQRIALLQSILSKMPDAAERVELLPAYSLVMSAATLVEVDKALEADLTETFAQLREMYREVVVIQ